ncbi:hypothetical protein HDU83_005466, partial [Entophlyctis luteolus]
MSARPSDHHEHHHHSPPPQAIIHIRASSRLLLRQQEKARALFTATAAAFQQAPAAALVPLNSAIAKDANARDRDKDKPQFAVARAVRSQTELRELLADELSLMVRAVTDATEALGSSREW